MTQEEHYRKGQEYLERADGNAAVGARRETVIDWAVMAQAHFLAALAAHLGENVTPDTP